MEKDISYLKRKNKYDVSAYDQIGSFLLKLFLERPPQERTYREFEAEASELAVSKQQSNQVRTVQQDERFLSQFLYSFYKTFETAGGNEEEELEPEPEPEDPAEYPDIPDLVSLSTRLQTVGVPFSSHDATELQLAMRRLAASEGRGDDKLSLFGKIGCYWIFRAETDAYIEPEEEAPEEFEVPEEEVVEEEPLEDVPEEEINDGEEKGEGEDADEAEEKAEEDGDQEGHEGGAEGDDLDEDKHPDGEDNGEDKGEGEEAEEELHSDQSIEEEFNVPTKTVKKVPTYCGKPFPLNRINKLPVEEHEGVNKDVFFVATDLELSQFASQIALELMEEERMKLYRKENRLQQRPTFVDKLLRSLYERPLSFVPLPEVTPEQMRVASLLPASSLIFTGNLQRAVNTSLPKFDGKECHLLRCIIARIQHECTIVPNKMYVAEVEEPEIEETILTEIERQARAIELRKERKLLELTRTLKVHEILYHFPSLSKRGEDEEPENCEAVYAEPAEDFAGFNNIRLLLSPTEWRYLLPRITGQGRVQPLSYEDYEAIDEPEPWEVDVALTLKQKRKEERERIKQEKKEAKERELEELREKLGEKRFAKYMAKREEEGEEQEEEEEDPSDPDDLHIEPDDYEVEDLEKPDPEEGSYDDWCKYYMYRLWTKLRIFHRPICPWDLPLLDNKTNIPLPQLFQPLDAEDRTRVNFRAPQKCRYHIDEKDLQNSMAVSNTVVSKWQFSCHPDPLNGDTFLTAYCTNWPGSVNLLYGARGKRHSLLYFGDGVSLSNVESNINLPDMCMVPFDVIEEDELPVAEQRQMYEAEQEKKRLKKEREEAERLAAEEGEENDEA